MLVKIETHLGEVFVPFKLQSVRYYIANQMVCSDYGLYYQDALNWLNRFIISNKEFKEVI
jgi:hypothetical protein